MPRSFVITEDVRDALVRYLVQKPYMEVEGAILALRALPELPPAPPVAPALAAVPKE